MHEAADSTLEHSARLNPQLAREAEQVSLLALHLVRCVELGDSSAAGLRFLRAFELGRLLGQPVGQLAPCPGE